MSNENELLARCPFCGGEAALTPVPTTQKADCCEVYVRCMDCDAVGPGITYEWGTEQDDPHPEAIAAWNRRAEPAPSSPVPVEAVGWQPIETAVRDPKAPDIILFARFEDQGGGFIEDIRIGRWASCTGPHGLIDGWESDEGVHPEGYFSFWIPLPAAPVHRETGE